MRSGAVSKLLWKISFFGLGAVCCLAEESVRHLYERARLLQEGNRNLEEAVRIYGRVVDRAKDDRALGARAQLEQGILYLRLGRDEQARQAFRKVIVEFPDQPPLVREARGRLGVNGSSKPAMRVRQIWATPGADDTGGPSPDGRYLSFTDWRSGEVSVRDLVTNETRLLTHTGDGGRATSSVFAPDSKRIAYWWTNWGSLHELRNLGIDNAPPRTLIQMADASWVWLIECSRVA